MLNKMENEIKRNIFVTSSILIILFLALGFVSKDWTTSLEVIGIVSIGLVVIFGLIELAEKLFP